MTTQTSCAAFSANNWVGDCYRHSSKAGDTCTVGHSPHAQRRASNTFKAFWWHRFHIWCRWTRWVLFFSVSALTNVIMSLCHHRSIQTIPLPQDASLTYKKKEWQTGLDNRVIILWVCAASCGERWFLKRNLWFTGSGKCGLDEHIMTCQGLQGQWCDALKMTHFMTRMYPAYMTTRTKLSHLIEKQKKN